MMDFSISVNIPTFYGKINPESGKKRKKIELAGVLAEVFP